MVNGIEHNGVDQADIVIRKVNIGIAVVLIVVRQSNTACEEHHGIFFYYSVTWFHLWCVLMYRMQVITKKIFARINKEAYQWANSGFFEWDSHLFKLRIVTAQNFGLESTWPACYTSLW